MRLKEQPVRFLKNKVRLDITLLTCLESGTQFSSIKRAIFLTKGARMLDSWSNVSIS